MKILRIINSGFQEGGAENGIVLLQPILEKKGHIIRTLASDSRPDLPHFNSYSFKSIVPYGVKKYFYYTFNPNSYLTLKMILKEFKPDVVNLHTMAQVSPSVLFLLKKYPTVLTIHGPEAFTKSLLPWYLPISDFKNGEYNINDLRFIGKMRYFYFRYIIGLIYRFGLRNVDIFITMSKYMQNLMFQDGLQTTYIPNGTTLLEYKPFKKEEITNTLVYAGRLEKFKGVDYLIEAMPEIISEFPDTQLFIAGDGGKKNDLEILTNKLNLGSNVKFLGHLNRNELEKLYQRSAIVIMPSTWPEAFGKIGIEAMSVGRPIVASDVGGISDWLIDGQTGFMIPPKDSKAIAEAVIKLLSNHNLLTEMSKKARAKSEEFDLNKHADEIERIYLRLIEKYRNKP